MFGQIILTMIGVVIIFDIASDLASVYNKQKREEQKWHRLVDTATIKR